MININFITNQSLRSTSGGWSGISYNMYKNLYDRDRVKINYVGPVDPPMIATEKIISRSRRAIGLQGDFAFFSDKRLRNIKEMVEEKKQDADYNFFFGQTPWIDCHFSTSYGVYMDADFLTYMRIYSNSTRFRKEDLMRIATKEEKWLQGAKNIFVGSQWTWDEMAKSYNLDESKKIITWTGGNIDIPEIIKPKKDLIFTFISLDFINKGGEIAVHAFQQVKAKYPSAVLKVIGQKPPEKILKIDGVMYQGFLRKNSAEDVKKFQSILKESFLMIHPTTQDTMGAVIIESGYYGCPTIAPKSFGIPELILNGKTGIVVDLPFTHETLSSKIIDLVENPIRYREMRDEVRKYTTTNFTWEVIGDKIMNTIIK